MPVKTVTATVGGVAAVVTYAGAAPGFVAGVMQVNLQIPTGVLAGPAIVQLTIDTISSPNTVTVVVGNKSGGFSRSKLPPLPDRRPPR
jgi:uncharacterized protein (TIGR03437 family)